MPPSLFIKNTLRLAEIGMGDGTVYGSATGATPNASQKTFALTGFSWIANVGADADDKANGYILYFPASGNKYHIVDWVASTDTATTYENPSALDTGACEIRRALVCNKQLAGNPAHFLADGQRCQDWKSAANTVIQVHLENLIDNGGFESGLVAPWVKSTSGGTTDTSGVNSSSPILGGFDYKIAIGDRTQVNLRNVTRRRLLKGRTYRVLFKARYSGTFVASQFTFGIVEPTGFAFQNLTFSNLSSGTSTTQLFRPTLAATNGWHSADFTPTDVDIEVGSLVWFRLNASTFDVFIDEVYIFEKVSVEKLVIYDGSNGRARITNLQGWNCATDRTGAVTSTDFNELVTANSDIYGAGVMSAEFSAVNYPVYLLSSSNLTQASEILLAEKFTTEFDPEAPYSRNHLQKDEAVFTARQGQRSVTKNFEMNVARPRWTMVQDADLDIWRNRYKPHHWQNRHPFGWQFDTNSPVLLMEDQSQDFEENLEDPRFPTIQLDLLEVVR